MKTLEQILSDRLLGEDVLEIRQLLNISQDKLSKWLNVSVQSVYLWEKNKMGISPENQARLIALVNAVVKANKKTAQA